MRDECIELREAVFVEQQLQPFARRELAALVLLLEPLRSPAELRFLAQCSQLGELVGRRHERDSFARSLVGPAGIEPATGRL